MEFSGKSCIRQNSCDFSGILLEIPGTPGVVLISRDFPGKTGRVGQYIRCIYHRRSVFVLALRPIHNTSCDATSCNSDTQLTIFFMFSTSLCISSAMRVHCTCAQCRNCTPFVYTARYMSQKFLQLLRQVPCDCTRQAVSCRNCRKSPVASQKVE